MHIAAPRVKYDKQVIRAIIFLDEVFYLVPEGPLAIREVFVVDCDASQKSSIFIMKDLLQVRYLLPLSISYPNVAFNLSHLCVLPFKAIVPIEEQAKHLFV
jgi:hypothetical protein